MRKTMLGAAILAALLATAGCSNPDANAALADLTASTIGDAVQIAVQGVLNDYLSQSNPDLTAPISQQIH